MMNNEKNTKESLQDLWDKWQRHGDEHSPPATLLQKFVCKHSLRQEMEHNVLGTLKIVSVHTCSIFKICGSGLSWPGKLSYCYFTALVLTNRNLQ